MQCLHCAASVIISHRIVFSPSVPIRDFISARTIPVAWAVLLLVLSVVLMVRGYAEIRHLKATGEEIFSGRTPKRLAGGDNYAVIGTFIILFLYAFAMRPVGYLISTFVYCGGYKDTSGHLGDFLRCLNHFRGTDFMLFQGMTQLAGVSLLMGADGFIPNISPVVPELCLKVYDYAKAGDIEKLKVYCELLLEAQDAFSNAVWHCCLQSGLFDAWLHGSENGQPSEPVTPEQKEKIRQALQRAGRKAAAAELLRTRL